VDTTSRCLLRARHRQCVAPCVHAASTISSCTQCEKQMTENFFGRKDLVASVLIVAGVMVFASAPAAAQNFNQLLVLATARSTARYRSPRVAGTVRKSNSCPTASVRAATAIAAVGLSVRDDSRGSVWPSATAAIPRRHIALTSSTDRLGRTRTAIGAVSIVLSPKPTNWLNFELPPRAGEDHDSSDNQDRSDKIFATKNFLFILFFALRARRDRRCRMYARCDTLSMTRAQQHRRRSVHRMYDSTIG